MDKRSTERTRFVAKIEEKAKEIGRGPLSGRWTATWKKMTKDCEGCRDFIPVDGVPCCWSGTVKRLAETDNPRRCQLV